LTVLSALPITLMALPGIMTDRILQFTKVPGVDLTRQAVEEVQLNAF
jgi:hypothetical protein